MKHGRCAHCGDLYRRAVRRHGGGTLLVCRCNGDDAMPREEMPAIAAAPKELRRTVLSVRLSAGEADAVKQRAARQGRTVNALMRAAIGLNP